MYLKERVISMHIKFLINKYRLEEKSDVSLLKRVLAYVVDWYIGGVISSIPIQIIYQFIVKQEVILANSIFILPKEWELIAGLFVLIIAFVYYILIPAYVWKGQTLGKKLLNIQIVNEDYSDITFKRLCIRQIVFMFLIEGRFIMPSTIFHEMLSILLQYNIVGIMSYICYCITFISVFMAIQLKSQRTLHDILGQTKVMNLNSTIVQKANKKMKRKNN